jgi:dihydropteroate synthase
MPWYERDAFIIANLKVIKTLGKPIYIGVSRKSFIGKITGIEEPSGRLSGSLAATALAIINGADVVRTHDVEETAQAVRVAEYLRDRRNH